MVFIVLSLALLTVAFGPPVTLKKLECSKQAFARIFQHGMTE